MFCPWCGGKPEPEYRYCATCGGQLPSEEQSGSGPKQARWFLGIPVVEADPLGSAIRVTRYREEAELHTTEGTVRVPNHHVRFSIWIDDHAVAAVSLPDDEARSLASFVLASVEEPKAAEAPTAASPA